MSRLVQIVVSSSLIKRNTFHLILLCKCNLKCLLRVKTLALVRPNASLGFENIKKVHFYQNFSVFFLNSYLKIQLSFIYFTLWQRDFWFSILLSQSTWIYFLNLLFCIYYLFKFRKKCFHFIICKEIKKKSSAVKFFSIFKIKMRAFSFNSVIIKLRERTS